VQNEEFKAAVGKYPTGITIVSTKYNNRFYGFTANSFTSVSLKPALISFCLNTTAGSFDAFFNAKHFAVNILSYDQADVAVRFASSNTNKFQNIGFTENSFGIPLINNVLSSIECEGYKQIECGDHYIFIGKALKVTINSDLSNKAPLIYYGKSYKELK
jgi:flavin reductase (DIM6/NTAB) family NADH-FMN oxidoreductase RutF